jgi:hypothetical protein
MSARDELDTLHSELVADAKRHPSYANNEESALYGYSEGAEHALDTVRLRGYRKPRTITTAEELDALPVGSVVIDRDRDVCQRFRGGWRATIHEPNDDPWLTDTLEVDLPAIVLHEPEPQS